MHMPQTPKSTRTVLTTLAVVAMLLLAGCGGTGGGNPVASDDSNATNATNATSADDAPNESNTTNASPTADPQSQGDTADSASASDAPDTSDSPDTSDTPDAQNTDDGTDTDTTSDPAPGQDSTADDSDQTGDSTGDAQDDQTETDNDAPTDSDPSDETDTEQPNESGPDGPEQPAQPTEPEEPNESDESGEQNESDESNESNESETHSLVVTAGEVQPVSGIEITLERLSDGATTTRTTGEDGTVTFDVTDGQYRVSGTDANGNSDAETVTIDNSEKQVVLGGLLQERPEQHTLTATVVDQNGNPVEGATVGGVGGILPSGADAIAQDTTNENGVATLDVFEGMTYLIDARSQELEASTDARSIEIDGDTSVTFTLPVDASGNTTPATGSGSGGTLANDQFINAKGLGSGDDMSERENTTT